MVRNVMCRARNCVNHLVDPSQTLSNDMYCTSKCGVKSDWTFHFRYYLMAMIGTIVSLACQVILLNMTFGGEFINLGYRLATYLYSVYFLLQQDHVNPLHEYFPHSTGCTIANAPTQEWNAKCTLGLNPLYSVVKISNQYIYEFMKR